MKKVIILFALYMCVTMIPSYAMKLTTNNVTDRYVPSRSTGFNNSYDSAYSDLEYNRSYYYTLGKGIRSDFANAKWGYVKKAEKKPLNSKKTTDIITSREAADYYMYDTYNRTRVIPSGVHAKVKSNN